MDCTTLLENLRKFEAPRHEALLKRLKEFNHHNQNWFGSPLPQGQDHTEIVKEIFRVIREPFGSSKGKCDVDDMEHEDADNIANAELLKELCGCLKILSRAKEFAHAISNVKGCFSTVLAYGNVTGERVLDCVDSSKKYSTNQQILELMNETETEALRVICNSVFHSKDSRSVYKEHCCSQYVTNRLRDQGVLQHHDSRVNSVLVKILFIMSALDTKERDNMRFAFNTVGALINLLERSLRSINENKTYCENDAQRRVFDLQLEEIREILKTLFNLTVKLCDETTLEESDCRNYCLLVEIVKEILTKPFFKCFLHNGLVSDVANVCINLPQSCLSKLVPGVRRRKWEDPVPHKDGYPLEYELKDMSAVVTLVDCLDKELQKGCDVQGNTSQAFSVLVSLCHICRCLRSVRKYLRIQVLPPIRDVSIQPEEADTLKGRIIKLMTHPVINIKTIAADFLFVLCKENPDRLVKHTGYGNAAGLLASRGMLGGRNSKISNDYSSDEDDSDTEEYTAVADMVDPITGGIALKKDGNPCENMTDEEKEANATELMKLVDKMSSLDVIKPAIVGEDGQPQVVDSIEARHLIETRLEKVKEDTK